MPVVNSPFESQYGFKGPGFSVDSEGNIVAASIITLDSQEQDDVVFVDFTITDSDNDFFFAEEGETANPTITLARQRSYNFSLDVPDLKFQILAGNEVDSLQYNTGLSHSDGSQGADAQNKSTGTLRWAVPLNAPSRLYYADQLRNNIGIINIVDPTGLFSTVDINSELNSTSSTTGAVTIAGGVGIEKDLHVGGSLNVSGVGIPRVSSLTNLELNAANKIILQVEDIKLGEISSSGLSITINNSTINNTTIGETAPTTAAFTSATVLNLPTVDNSVTNRQYVDSTALSLAIAFGL